MVEIQFRGNLLYRFSQAGTELLEVLIPNCSPNGPGADGNGKVVYPDRVEPATEHWAGLLHVKGPTGTKTEHYPVGGSSAIRITADGVAKGVPTARNDQKTLLPVLSPPDNIKLPANALNGRVKEMPQASLEPIISPHNSTFKGGAQQRHAMGYRLLIDSTHARIWIGGQDPITITAGDFAAIFSSPHQIPSRQQLEMHNDPCAQGVARDSHLKWLYYLYPANQKFDAPEFPCGGDPHPDHDGQVGIRTIFVSSCFGGGDFAGGDPPPE